MPKIRNKCENFMEKYEDRLIDLFMKEMTPKEICRELGQCILQMDFSTNDDLHVSIVAIPVANDDIFSVVNSAEDEIYDPNSAYVQADSTLCVICQTVMTQLEKELSDKTTQDEIKQTIRNICHSMPKSFDAQCTKFIDSYATLIISLIDTTPPKEICTQLNCCAKVAINLDESKGSVRGVK